MSHLHQELTVSCNELCYASVRLAPSFGSVPPLDCHFTIVNLANICFESMEKLKYLGVTQSKFAFIQKLKVKSKINIKLK